LADLPRLKGQDLAVDTFVTSDQAPGARVQVRLRIALEADDRPRIGRYQAWLQR
tara:strand:+ start:5834 stop:5995 length:162 start_codon:yes stop_codon:yes gene_type:complete